MLGTFRRQKTIHNTLGPFGCLDFHGNEPFPLAENEAHFIQKVHFCQVISLYLLCFQGEKKNLVGIPWIGAQGGNKIAHEMSYL